MNGHVRPLVDIHMPILYTAAEAIAAIGLLVSLVLIIWVWHSLPEQIPTHFGAVGKPDGWGPKGFTVAVPLTAFFLWVGLTILGRYPNALGYPVSISQANALYQYRLMMWILVVSKIEVTWLFTYITWKTVQVSFAKAEGLGAWFLPLSLILVVCTMIMYFVFAARGG